MDLQSLIAAGIVALTIVVFLLRLARPGRKSGCSHGCGCGKDERKSG